MKKRQTSIGSRLIGHFEGKSKNIGAGIMKSRTVKIYIFSILLTAALLILAWGTPMAEVAQERSGIDKVMQIREQDFKEQSSESQGPEEQDLIKKARLILRDKKNVWELSDEDADALKKVNEMFLRRGKRLEFNDEEIKFVEQIGVITRVGLGWERAKWRVKKKGV
ncbi:MAG: hypothetical protein LBS61_02330 [Endomicrobium sp.]|nr:hypothetical protein [Endomicrobium sp.]